MNIDFKVVYQSYDCSIALSEEMKSYYIRNLTDVVRQLSADLDIPPTCKIVVPDDFEKELKEFQLKYNLVVGFTKNDMGTAYAKVLDYTEDGILYSVVFVNKAIIFALQSDNIIENLEEQKDQFTYLRKIAINVIHHELIHVYDNYMNGTLYEEMENNNGILSKQMRNIAIVVWKEYYACRRTASTYYMDLENDIKDWKQQVLDVEEKIKDVINQYRTHGDINVVDRELQSRVTILLNYAAYFQGHLFRYSDFNTLCQIVQIINEQISSSFMYDIWSKMFYKLNELFITYLNWDSNAFDNLSQTILKCWNNVGVFPEVTGNGGLYYSIP